MTKSFELKRLTLDAKEDIEAVTGRFPPYCDFNFASLFVWDVEDDTRYARVGDSLVLELCDNVDRSPLYTFMGTSGVAELAEDLLARSMADGYGDALRIVPEEVCDVLRRDARFEVTPDPDNDDYLMSVATLANGMTGSRKAEALRFERAFPSAVVESIALAGENGRARLTTLFETWAGAAANTEPLAVVEDRIAFGRALANAERLGLEAFGVVARGVLVACELVEIKKPYAVSHFQKLDRRATGVVAFLNREVARRLGERGVSLINFEQDMGVPGLRHAKRSYHPVGYLKKFTVRKARSGA
jgi:uncharacterized protein